MIHGALHPVGDPYGAPTGRGKRSFGCPKSPNEATRLSDPRSAWWGLRSSLTRVTVVACECAEHLGIQGQYRVCLSGPKEPIDTGHSHNPADDASRAHRVNGEVPTTPAAGARNRGRL